MSQLSLREQRVVELLERYSELVDPIRSGNGFGSGGLVLMPHEKSCGVYRLRPPVCTCTLRSVGELERLLRVMRGDRSSPLLELEGGERVSLRQCWWHVNAWWLTVSWVLVTPSLPRGRRKSPVRLQVDEWGRVLPIRVARRTPGAREDVALCGVSWLADSWGLASEPMLPVGVAV